MRRHILPLLGLLVAAACAAPAAEPGHRGPLSPLTGSGGINAAEHLEAPYVILWSFDGFRADYLDWYDTPWFDRMAAEGARAEAMIPSFPSMTFPNHYGIATGLHPQSHGIVANEFWDPERGAWYDFRDRSTVEDGSWYGGEPIWVTAESQGMVSAAYFFVGTEADVRGVRPTNWKRFDGAVPNEARVDSALAWLQLPPESRPHLITLYVSDVDGAGHDFGPSAPETRAAVARADSLLGRLLTGLDALPPEVSRNTYVVLVADHGMAPVSRSQVEYLEDHIDTSRVTASAVSAYANLFVDGDAADVREVHDRIAAGLRHGRVWQREDVPADLHFSDGPRVGDLIIVMDEGWRVYLDRSQEPEREGGGQHGYPMSTAPTMGALFMARGPDVPAGLRLPPFRNIHVYPWLAGVLGLEPARTDGTREGLAARLGR